MALQKQIFIDPSPVRDPKFYVQARKLGRKLFKISALRRFHPHLRRLSAVASPAGHVSIQLTPANPSKRHCDTITVLSANLWHDWPRHRLLKERLQGFVRLAEQNNADVVLLQEVSRTPHVQSDQYIAQELGMAWVYSRANGHEAIGFEEGLAVFSRFPLEKPLLHQLGTSTNPFVRRLVLGVSVTTPCGDLLVFSTHLSILPRQNRNQQAHLRSWISQLAGDQTAVIAGDFNAHETTPQIRQTQLRWQDTYRSLHPDSDGTTHLLHWPWGNVLRRKRLDYIFLHDQRSNWRIDEARHVFCPKAPLSDHYAVLTRLTPEAQQ